MAENETAPSVPQTATQKRKAKRKAWKQSKKWKNVAQAANSSAEPSGPVLGPIPAPSDENEAGPAINSDDVPQKEPTRDMIAAEALAASLDTGLPVSQAENPIEDQERGGLTTSVAKDNSSESPPPFETIATTVNRRKVQRSSATPIVIENGTESKVEEMLARVRTEQLREIAQRNRARGQDVTTSLVDLEIARKPPRATRKEKLEENTWESNLAKGSVIGKVPSPVDGLLHASELLMGSQENIGSRYSSFTKQIERSIGNKDNSSWAFTVDQEPAQVEVDINSIPWGPPVVEDASLTSDDSILPMNVETESRHPQPAALERPPQGWDGQFIPPPADWDGRPKFSNNNPASEKALMRWMDDIVAMTSGVRGGSCYSVIATEFVKNVDWCPDGFSMVERHVTVHKGNAHKYGYEDPEATILSQPLKPTDFGDWGKLDLGLSGNVERKNETTENLVSNWLVNTTERRLREPTDTLGPMPIIEAPKTEMPTIEVEAMEQKYEATLKANTPLLNIYLRPAVNTDLKQMLEIYNQYVKYSARPAETFPTTIDDMQSRLEGCRSNRLPIIVAVMKNKATATSYDRNSAFFQQYTNQPYGTIMTNHNPSKPDRQEKVVGWASATDFTAADFVERIAVETEIYVDPESRQKGVGRCLMDKILEALDRGYLKRGGYPFHCAQEIRHEYNDGGGRDIHKIMIIVRKWKMPKDLKGRKIVRNKTNTKGTNLEKMDDRENDYDHWLKGWLESWGFQVEGVLTGIGAKNGRYIDAVYLGRETSWQPAEGQIPPPLAGTY